MMYSTPATPLSERDFHDRIYRGEILRFDAIPAMLELAQFAQKFLAQAFHPHPPPQIHQHLSHEEQIPRFAQLQKQFWKQDEVSHLWQDIFRTIGLDPQGLTRDHLAFLVTREFEIGDFHPNMEIAEARFFAVRELPEDVTGGTRRRVAEVFDGAVISENW